MNDKYIYIEKGTESLLKFKAGENRPFDLANDSITFLKEDTKTDNMRKIVAELVPVFQKGILLTIPKILHTHSKKYNRKVGEIISTSGIIKPDFVKCGAEFIDKFECIILSNLLYAVLETQSEYWYNYFKDGVYRAAIPLQSVISELDIKVSGTTYNIVVPENSNEPVKVVVYLKVDEVNDEYKFIYVPFEIMRRMNIALERNNSVTGYIDELSRYAELQPDDNRCNRTWLKRLCTEVMTAIKFKNPFES